LSAQTSVKNHPGIYDGNIGSDKIILVEEGKKDDLLKGYFVLNRGKSVEEVHPFFG